MAELLKFAGEARKSHIKLTNVAYGQALSKELLTLAEAVESLFKDMQAALDAGNEKTLVSLLEKAKLKEEEGEKAKAWIRGANDINTQGFPQENSRYSDYLSICCSHVASKVSTSKALCWFSLFFSHVPVAASVFPFCWLPVPDVASAFPLLSLQAAASALLKKPGKRKGGEKKGKEPKKKKQT